MPLEEVKGLILKSLDVFAKELRGFDPKRAVFNFPYNQSSPELEQWLPSVMMAFRTTGGMINPPPGPATVKVTTGGWGPDNAEKHVDETVEKLLAQSDGWMVYNLHGLDEEGWGTDPARLFGKAFGQAAGEGIGADSADREGVTAGQGPESLGELKPAALAAPLGGPHFRRFETSIPFGRGGEPAIPAAGDPSTNQGAGSGRRVRPRRHQV